MFSYLSYKELSQSVHISYDIHLLSDEIFNVNIFFVTTAVFSFSSGKNVILQLMQGKQYLQLWGSVFNEWNNAIFFQRKDAV